MTDKRSSNRNIVYRCTKCGADKDRDDLTVKQVVFLTMGERGKRLKARVVDWLCEECREAEPAWNRPPRQTSPGFADVNAPDE